MNGLARILDHCITKDLGCTGFRIDLNINNVGGERNTRTIGGHLVVSCYRSSRLRRLGGNGFQRKRRQIAVFITNSAGFTILPDNVVHRNIHHLGCTFFQHFDGFSRSKNGRHTGGKRPSATFGGICMPQRCSISNIGLDLIIRYAEFFGSNQSHRRPGAPNIDGTLRQADRSINTDIQIDTGLPTNIEPEAAGHTTPLVFLKFRLHVRMITDGFQGRFYAYGTVSRAIGSSGAFPCHILQPQLHWIHIKFSSEDIQGTFNTKRHHRRRRCSISSHFRSVRNNINTNGLTVRQVVAGPCGHTAKHSPHTGKSSSIVTTLNSRRGNGAIFTRTYTHIHRRRARGPGCLEHLLSTHDHFNWPVGFT